MVRFMTRNKIRPVVDRIVTDITYLDGIDGLFEDLRNSMQFEKLVVEIKGACRPYQYQGKL